MDIHKTLMNQPANTSKISPKNTLEDHPRFDDWPAIMKHGENMEKHLLVSAAATEPWDLGGFFRTCASITFQRSWCWCYLEMREILFEIYSLFPVRKVKLDGIRIHDGFFDGKGTMMYFLSQTLPFNSRSIGW